MRFRTAILWAFLCFTFVLVGQNDTIHVKNGNVLYGEIKGLSSGILTMSTSYSDSDFTIDFSEVTRLSIERQCFVILSNGERRIGNLRSEKPDMVTLTEKDGSVITYKLSSIITLTEIESLFWRRFNGHIDLGFNLTRANNTSQFTFSTGLDYKGPFWIFDADLTSLRNRQDNTAGVERTNAVVELVRVLPKKWFLLGTLMFLSNTEQSIDARYGMRIGGGRYLIINNKLLLGMSVGFNHNIENFQNESLDNSSQEFFISGNFSMFDFKDFKLNTTIDVYPSISENERLRIDYTFDVKYDLPWDLYIKLGFQFNYDNQAIVTGSNLDYILNSGLGWSF